MSIKCPKNISTYLNPFLKVLSKPRRKYFLVYLTGSIFLNRFRSIREIAAFFGESNTDGLHHFITHAVRIIEGLNEQLQLFCATTLQRMQPVLLAIDDTVAPRQGPSIEGLGWHHSAKGLIKGLCAVTALLKIGSKRWVFAIRGYRPKKLCPSGEFKSKVALAIEILHEALLLFPRELTIVMDTWYACAPVLNTIQEGGATFVAALKRNRYVYLNGVKTAVHLLAKRRLGFRRIRISKRKCFRAASVIVWLPSVGKVRLLISFRGQEARFFVTNCLEMTDREMIKTYLDRFTIETFHKDIKQHLGFGEMFMRSWEGVQTHWTILAIAYNLIALASEKPSESFRRKIRHFRNTVNSDLILTLSNI